MGLRLLNLIQIPLLFFNTFFVSVVGLFLVPFGQKFAVRVISFAWSRLMLATCFAKVKTTFTAEFDLSKPRIYVCNHQSHMDIPALYKALPVPLFFIAKIELKRIPVFGWFMNGLGMIFVDRQNRDKAMSSVSRAVEEIKSGKNIMSFPEGTRTKNGQIQRFKRGTFTVAQPHNLSVVPVAIRGADKVIPAGKFEVQPGTIEVIVGKPVTAEKLQVDNPTDMANACRTLVLDLLKQHV